MSKYKVNPISDEEIKKIISNSVQSSKNRLVGNAAETKKQFVKPIANLEGWEDSPSVVGAVNRVVEDINEEFAKLGEDMPAVINGSVYLNVSHDRLDTVEQDTYNNSLWMDYLNYEPQNGDVSLAIIRTNDNYVYACRLVFNGKINETVQNGYKYYFAEFTCSSAAMLHNGNTDKQVAINTSDIENLGKDMQQQGEELQEAISNASQELSREISTTAQALMAEDSKLNDALNAHKQMVNTELSKKQDNLVFADGYNSSSNKVATENTVSKKITEVVDGADKSLDTLKEIADWINAHPKSVAEINAAIAANSEAIAANSEAIAANSEAIPLVPNRPIYVNRTYATIRKDIELGANDNNYWLESSLGDTYYAFLSTDFNRQAKKDDKFGATCSSSDGYVFNISAQVIEVQGSIVYFKILDNNLDGIDEFVLLYNPMTVPLVSDAVFEFNDKDYNYLLKQYNASEELDTNGIQVAWLERTPHIGERFFGIGITMDKRNVGFTAEVTRLGEEDGALYCWFKFVDLVLLGEDYPTLNRTMRYSNTSIEAFTAKDENGEYTFEGTAEYGYSIETKFFSIPPRVGNTFLGTAEVYPTGAIKPYIVTFTAEVTKLTETGTGVEYKFVDVTILHNPVEIQEAINSAVASVENKLEKLEISKVVQELPEIGTPGKFYLVPNHSEDTNDMFDSWLWVNKGTEEAPDYKWEFEGTKKFEIDTSELVKFTDYPDPKNFKAGVIKVDNYYGFNLGKAGSAGALLPVWASNTEIDSKSNRRFINPQNFAYAFKMTATDNKEIWTDDEKAAACETIGALAEKPNTSPSGMEQFYAVNKNQEQVLIAANAFAATANTVALRDGNGCVRVNNPVNNSDATPKSFVVNLPDKLTVTEEEKVEWAKWIGATRLWRHSCQFQTDEGLNVYYISFLGNFSTQVSTLSDLVTLLKNNNSRILELRYADSIVLNWSITTDNTIKLSVVVGTNIQEKALSVNTIVDTVTEF